MGLILLIAISSIIVIYNAFSISTTERKKQFGMLNSIGATSKQIKNMVLMEGMITLTMKEQRRNDVIVKLINQEINTMQASKLLGLSVRQIKRIKKKYLNEGIKSVVHKNKNRSTGRGYSQALKNQILKLYQEEYLGRNFHHFNDTLEDYHNIEVSDSFIYSLLTKEGVSSPCKYKQGKKTYPPRERKENAGEFIQVDASKHQWFFGDNTYYYLHGGIDDATGRVSGCFLAKEETIFGYQMIIWQTLENYGIPACLYTDYRTIFKSNKKELTLEEEIEGKEIKNTRFANMLKHLGVDITSTRCPKAKGRIERLWRTFQDRLYKELKKKGVNTIEKANEYITNVFLPKYNSRFALPIDDTKSFFISLDKDFDFNKELAVWSEHKVYHNSYLRYNKCYHIILESNEKVYLPTKNKVPVYTFVDGTDYILYNDKWYDLKPIKDNKISVQKVVKSIKTQEEINAPKTHKPSANHPWRTGKFSKINYRTLNKELATCC